MRIFVAFGWGTEGKWKECWLPDSETSHFVHAIKQGEVAKVKVAATLASLFHPKPAEAKAYQAFLLDYVATGGKLAQVTDYAKMRAYLDDFRAIATQRIAEQEDVVQVAEQDPDAPEPLVWHTVMADEAARVKAYPTPASELPSSAKNTGAGASPFKERAYHASYPGPHRDKPFRLQAPDRPDTYATGFFVAGAAGQKFAQALANDQERYLGVDPGPAWEALSNHGDAHFESKVLEDKAEELQAWHEVPYSLLGVEHPVEFAPAMADLDKRAADDTKAAELLSRAKQGVAVFHEYLAHHARSYPVLNARFQGGIDSGYSAPIKAVQPAALLPGNVCEVVSTEVKLRGASYKLICPASPVFVQDQAYAVQQILARLELSPSTTDWAGL